MAMAIWSDSTPNPQNSPPAPRPRLVAPPAQRATPRLLEPRAFASIREASVDWSAVRRAQSER